MKPPLIYLSCAAAFGVFPAGAASYCIDFGPLSSAASYKYISTTKLQGWNNVAFSSDQTKAGDITFSSNYYGGDKDKTHENASGKEIIVYSTEGAGQSITMSGVKNGSSGNLSMIGGSGFAYAPDSLYKKFDPAADLTVMPSMAYQDFITADHGASFTLTFSGLAAGVYHISLAAGRTYASGGTAPGASYSLNGVNRTIAGNDGAAGQYAGMLEWQGMEIGEDGTLTLTVSGLYDESKGEWSSAALNGLVMMQVPEPSAAFLNLLGMAGLAFRRRRG